MPHPDDLTPAQARANIAAHEKAHGHDMSDKIPPGQLKHDDVPTDADLTTPPEWFKAGKPRPAHPDD